MPSIAHYNLGDRVGTERVAEVYRGTDTTHGRTVTVKILRPEVAADAARRDALLASARAATSLSHPSIAAVYEVGEEDVRHFVVFEHTAGETLRAATSGSPLNLRRALDLGVQISDALADAHGQGFVHGSLHPESIIVTQKSRVKILGFGLPSFPADLRIQSGPALTADEIECLAPERVLDAKVDGRADIFSLGCVLYEMLTGRQPFAAATGSDTAVAILTRTPPPPSHFNARIPDALDRIVERCLAKSVEGRGDSAATVALQLREMAAQIEAEDKERPDVPAATIVRAVRRRSLWPLVLLILLCLLGLSALAVIWASR